MPTQEKRKKKLALLMERRKRLGNVGALDFLIDRYKRLSENNSQNESNQILVPITYEPFLCKKVEWNGDIDKYKRAPSNLPKEFNLPPLTGMGNDYSPLFSHVDPKPELNKIAVSIVVLSYNRAEPLSKTLAGIVLQEYPQDLIEVIVTDDGSSDDTADVIKKYSEHLNIRHVWQPDIGFRAAAARNNGVSLARNDFVILLDVDMFPSRELVSNYVKWWRVIDQITLVGPRKYIDLNDKSPLDILNGNFTEDKFEEVHTNNVVAGKTDGSNSVDWRLEIFNNTNNLITEKRPYRVFASGNVAFSKKKFMEIGGFDERFKSWGYEDTELGFRFYNHGCYILPSLSAWAYHQEPKGGINEVDRLHGKSESGHIFGDLCPHYRTLTAKKEHFSSPTVSIYIPAYNAEGTICDSIESALRQTFKDLEVCVCDDGSTDSTLEVLEKYYGSNPRVKFVTQRNGGIGAASNTALSLCRGMFVGQLDSDDYLARDVVEKCVAEFINRPEIGLVYTTYENEFESGEIKPGYNYPIYTREKMITAMIAHHFRMFRKLYYHRTTGFNERIRNAVDYDFYLKLAEICDAKHLNIVGYRRRLHGENTSVKHFAEQMKNTAVVVNDSLKRMNSKFIAENDSLEGSKLSYTKL